MVKQIRYAEGQRGDDKRSNRVPVPEDAECCVVETERVTVVAALPAGIVPEGEKEAAVPVGNPDAESVTVFVVAPWA